MDFFHFMSYVVFVVVRKIGHFHKGDNPRRLYEEQEVFQHFSIDDRTVPGFQSTCSGGSASFFLLWPAPGPNREKNGVCLSGSTSSFLACPWHSWHKFFNPFMHRSLQQTLSSQCMVLLSLPILKVLTEVPGDCVWKGSCCYSLKFKPGFNRLHWIWVPLAGSTSVILQWSANFPDNDRNIRLPGKC